MASFFQVKGPKWHWNWISPFSTYKLGFVRKKKKKTISKICMLICVILIIKLQTNLWSGTQEWIYLEFKKNVVKISGILIFKSMEQRWHLNWIFTFRHHEFSRHVRTKRHRMLWCECTSTKSASKKLKHFHVLTFYICHQ